MKKDKQNVFMADKVMINGPRQDGNYRVTFDVGEYQYNNIKNLVLLNGYTLAVAVVPGKDLKKRNVNNPAEEEDDSRSLTEIIESGKQELEN